jgi:copper homeostasis protein
MYQLEVIAFNIASCITAEKAGAHRIELCDNPGEGGTTPSAGMIKRALELTSLLLYPIIRPRGGDFLYSDDEFKIMMNDVELCKAIGTDGVVFGFLNADGTVDTDRTKRLVDAAYPLGVTFHRAFDRVNDPVQALEDVIACGCERILTSGLRPGVTEGADILKSLVEQAAGRIIIMPGSGLRSANLREIADKTGAREFHSSARNVVPTTMSYINPEMNEDLVQTGLDEQEVRAMRAVIDQLEKENQD